jgi:hypothetical protein
MMRLGWWSRLKFEPRRRRMAIDRRSLSGHLQPFAFALKWPFKRLLYSN